MTTLENFYFGNITPSEYKQSKDTKEKLDKEKEALSQLKAADQTPEVKKQAEALERQIIADEQSLKSLRASGLKSLPLSWQRYISN